MTIVYGLVAVGKTVLAEHTATSVTGNFPTVTRVLLEKIPSIDGRMTYQYDNYNFHYICENNICYLCMSDNGSCTNQVQLTSSSNNGGLFDTYPQQHQQNQSSQGGGVLDTIGSSSYNNSNNNNNNNTNTGVKHRIPFAFLNDMKLRFVELYGTLEPLTAIAFRYNDEFNLIIDDRMQFYNSSDAEKNIDSIGYVKNQIEDVKLIMVQNIEKVLERGEKIELLVDKTDRLNQQAYRFEFTSRKLRQQMRYKQIKCYILLGIAITCILFIATASTCGGITFHHCRRK